jgi:hypothetical protein
VDLVLSLLHPRQPPDDFRPDPQALRRCDSGVDIYVNTSLHSSSSSSTCSKVPAEKMLTTCRPAARPAGNHLLSTHGTGRPAMTGGRQPILVPGTRVSGRPQPPHPQQFLQLTELLRTPRTPHRSGVLGHNAGWRVSATGPSLLDLRCWTMRRVVPPSK